MSDATWARDYTLARLRVNSEAQKGVIESNTR
jgi:hypothetical protein